jgi:prepilin-type N-terminal cleavage/methylation domain-containing protein
MLRKLRGFTLIELVIVLAILAILAAVAIPKFVDLSKKARKATAESELGSLRAAAQLYYASTAVSSSGVPAWPADKAGLTARLDVKLTQLDNLTTNNNCTSTATSFCWNYKGNASSTGAGKVWKTGGMGWNW